MIIIEKQSLQEMGFRIVSSTKEHLSFTIVVKTPDKGKYDHAHIFKLGTKDTEIGAFVITKNPPKEVADLIGYTKGKHEGLKNLTPDQLQSLVIWAGYKNELYPGTNWQTLQYEYAVNRKS